MLVSLLNMSQKTNALECVCVCVFTEEDVTRAGLNSNLRITFTSESVTSPQRLISLTLLTQRCNCIHEIYCVCIDMCLTWETWGQRSRPSRSSQCRTFWRASLHEQFHRQVSRSCECHVTALSIYYLCSAGNRKMSL